MYINTKFVQILFTDILKSLLLSFKPTIFKNHIETNISWRFSWVNLTTRSWTHVHGHIYRESFLLDSQRSLQSGAMSFVCYLARRWNRRPVLLSLVNIRFNGLSGVIKCYINIVIQFCDFVNSLFDSLWTPMCSQWFDSRVVHSLVKPLPFCQCDLVLVPWTHDALLPIKFLRFKEKNRQCNSGYYMMVVFWKH